MSRWPAPTRADHDKFCHTEGWRRVRESRGRTGTHHLTYEFDVSDGRTLRTRVSHPPNRTTYGPQMWAHILRDQLQCNEATFWACVRDGVLPERGAGATRAAGTALPADVVNLLVHRFGVDESEVAGMTRAEAIQRLNEFWAPRSS